MNAPNRLARVTSARIAPCGDGTVLTIVLDHTDAVINFALPDEVLEQLQTDAHALLGGTQSSGTSSTVAVFPVCDTCGIRLVWTDYPRQTERQPGRWEHQGGDFDHHARAVWPTLEAAL